MTPLYQICTYLGRQWIECTPFRYFDLKKSNLDLMGFRYSIDGGKNWVVEIEPKPLP